MADLALEFKVSVFVYSSFERRGDQFDDEQVLSGKAKVNIERHVRQLGEKGLPWTYVLPSTCRRQLKSVLLQDSTTCVLYGELRWNNRFHYCRCSESRSQIYNSYSFDCESFSVNKPARIELTG